MAKRILFNEESLDKLQKGVNTFVNAVASTLGPKGRNVIIEGYEGMPPLSTKDGVTVARSLTLEDQFENMGAQMIRDAAEKTVIQCADATTTTCVLARGIFNAGLGYIKQGHSPVDIKKGIDLAVKEVVKYIKDNAIPVKEDWGKIRDIAIISTNNDKELGTLIADTLQKVGGTGAISVQKGLSLETEVEIVKGMNYDRGFISPYFINRTEKPICELDNPLILIHDKEIHDNADIMQNIVGPCFKTKQSLLIIAQDVDGAALQMLIVNKNQQGFPVCATNAPSRLNERKEIFLDMSTMFGGGLITEDVGRNLKSCTIEDLGKAEKVIVTANSTTIIGGKGSKEAIDKRIEQLKNQINQEENLVLKEALELRLSKLSSGVAIIKVGGTTETEAEERKFRVDDAVGATKSAIKEGVMAGGGLAYLKAANFIREKAAEEKTWDLNFGLKCVTAALAEPFETICKNAGVEKTTSFHSMESHIGYNALTDKEEDLVEAGVIDSAMALRCSIENAASVAGLLLTSNVSMTEIKEEKPERKK